MTKASAGQSSSADDDDEGISLDEIPEFDFSRAVRVDYTEWYKRAKGHFYEVTDGRCGGDPTTTATDGLGAVLRRADGCNSADQRAALLPSLVRPEPDPGVLEGQQLGIGGIA